MSDLSEFRAFVESRSPALVASAWLLTGNEASAHDLVQAALLRAWQRWDQIVTPEPYVRRVMMSQFLSWRRRLAGNERLLDDAPDTPDLSDGFASADLRQDLRQALARLPRGQRAALVLRYFDDLSEAQTATALGCSVGTVKSQASRALGRLRADPAVVALLPQRKER